MNWRQKLQARQDGWRIDSTTSATKLHSTDKARRSVQVISGNGHRFSVNMKQYPKSFKNADRPASVEIDKAVTGYDEMVKLCDAFLDKGVMLVRQDSAFLEGL